MIPTKPLIYLLAVGIYTAGVWYHGYHTRDLSATSEAQALKLASAEQKLQSSERMRIKEKYYQQLVTAADAEYQEKLENERKNSNDIIAGLESNSVRIKSRFKCPMPSAAGSSSLGNDQASAGLQVQDAKDIIRESARADEIVLQLQECQAYIDILALECNKPLE